MSSIVSSIGRSHTFLSIMNHKLAATVRGSTVLAFVGGILVTLVITKLTSDHSRKRPQQNYRDGYYELQLCAALQNPACRRGIGMVEGIEGTIGNTPLIRIRSLSEETGCEILAKAEVRLQNQAWATTYKSVPQWRGWKSQRSGGSQYSEDGSIWQSFLQHHHLTRLG